jgi:hypothetical protein
MPLHRREQRAGRTRGSSARTPGVSLRLFRCDRPYGQVADTIVRLVTVSVGMAEEAIDPALDMPAPGEPGCVAPGCPGCVDPGCVAPGCVAPGCVDPGCVAPGVAVGGEADGGLPA